MVLKEKVKCAREKSKIEWENKGSRGKIKGTRAKEENKR